MDGFDWPERDSREWLLGPRGATLEPWADAVAHLPLGGDEVVAVLCVPNTAPTIWMRDDVVDDLGVWAAVQGAVQGYDAGDRDPELWRPVLDGDAHLLFVALA